MPKEVVNCHPSTWLEHIQSSDFFENFETDNSLLELALDADQVSKIDKMADRESDRVGLIINRKTAINFILFRYLYGTASCRVMSETKSGLFLPRLVKASANANDGKNILIKLSLPERISTDLNFLVEVYLGDLKLDQFVRQIIKNFLDGYIQPDNKFAAKNEDDDSTPQTRYGNKLKKRNFSLSTHFKETLTVEANLHGMEISSFLLNVLSDLAFGINGKSIFFEPGYQSIFAEPRLVPVCNSSDSFGFRSTWGKNTEKITVNMPLQFDLDLSDFKKQYEKHQPWKSRYTGEFVRNILHIHFVGNLFMLRNSKQTPIKSQK